MIHRILEFSLRQRALVILATLLLIGVGIWSAMRLPIDAVPDITNIQVQFNTSVPALAPEEIEKLVTVPLENEMAGLPNMIELRSLSKFGLSQVTMVFKDGTDVYRTRQLASERLQAALEHLPPELQPRLAPISTGLGEIFHYIISYKEDATNKPPTRYERLMALKTTHDYFIKPLLRSTPGVAEVNSIGGYEKQIVIMPDPQKLANAGMTLHDLASKVSENVENVGGGLIEAGGEQIVVRAASRVQNSEEIANLPLKFRASVEAMTVKDVAEVGIGSSFRTGAATDDGEEAVVGSAIMLMGENSRLVARAVNAKLKDIQDKLPSGIQIHTGYDRSDLVNRTIHTVEKNLFEGALLVMMVLLALLGNWRAALIVSLAIPLSMLFAMTGMVESKISGNLMSLGAIDFGLIIDGAVVMVENIIRHLAHRQHQLQRNLTAQERVHEILVAAKEVANPMFFGVLIITVVYIPILALTGIEGKMFKPMAITVIFALLGALLLALTVMPVLCSFFLSGKIKEEDNLLMCLFKVIYRPLLRFALSFRWLLVILGTALLLTTVVMFSRLGSEFVPQLNEGSLVIQMMRSASLGMNTSLDLQLKSEQVLRNKFPEISHIFSRVGTAEIANDPMPPNLSDTFVSLQPQKTWRKINGHTATQAQLIALMQRELTINVPGQAFLFTQPIQMRFNEIMAGARADISAKVYGEDYTRLEQVATQVRDALRSVAKGSDVEFEAIGRSPMLEITPDRAAMKRFNVQAGEVNHTIKAAMAGEEVGTMVEGNQRFEIVVRLPEKSRENMDVIKRLPVRTEDDGMIALAQIAKVDMTERVGTINREANHRRLAILINLRGQDVESFVRQATAKIKEQVKFPEGYYYEFGGQFKNLQEARARLAVVVPVALLLIFVFIFFAFGSVRQVLVVYTGIPLAITGGVFALAVRGMPFSISAGVGFIALSGVAVLNGLVMISYYNLLRERGRTIDRAVEEGSLTRLRPVLMTAFVASIGFLPMALATGSGAEVQRPLATVVIGGIISSTFLTLILLPTLYEWSEKKAEAKRLKKG
jgi:heavy metal efflux system protein